MSRGDNLIGVPITYKGINMRSKLESKVATVLDILNIKWEYEPKLFLLSNGIYYKPDFYLTELKMWIEVKGLILEHNKKISTLFVQDNKTELILISNENWLWFSTKDFDDGICIDDNVQIGFCSKCNKYFFCSNLGSYHCRNCNTHEGDHDLIRNKFNKEIDFYNINSIKEIKEIYGNCISEL